jgi:hypothetical protein
MKSVKIGNLVISGEHLTGEIMDGKIMIISSGRVIVPLVLKNEGKKRVRVSFWPSIKGKFGGRWLKTGETMEVQINTIHQWNGFPQSCLRIGTQTYELHTN